MPIRLLVFLLLCSFCSSAQVQQFTLNGSLGVQGGGSFKYKMVFTDSFGYIKGYALTYEQENKDTRALITGGIDRVNRTLSFRETSIVSNNGFYSSVTICLIEASLQYKEENGMSTLSGTIVSSDLANASCSKGSLLFIDKAELKRIFDEAPIAAAPGAKPPSAAAPVASAKPVEKPKAFRVVYDTAAAVPAVRNAPVKAPDEITSGADQSYEWVSDTVVIDVWDGGRVDNDFVTILLNGQPILSRYQLVKEKKQLRLPLSGKATDVITITAVNEGNEPPNTANLLLTDGAVQHPVVAYNTIGKQAVIRLRRVQR